jgi:hypothetical protein
MYDFFSKSEILKHKKHWSLLFVHKKQTIIKSCIPKNKNEKLQKKIKVN